MQVSGAALRCGETSWGCGGVMIILWRGCGGDDRLMLWSIGVVVMWFGDDYGVALLSGSTLNK